MQLHNFYVQLHVFMYLHTAKAAPQQEIKALELFACRKRLLLLQ